MHISPARVEKPELLVIDSKRFRQAGIACLIDLWAETMGLTVKAVVPDAPLDTCCVPANCEMIIISVGSASIEDAQHQVLIESVRRLIPQAALIVISDSEDPQEICTAFKEGAVGFLPTSIEPAVAFQALSFIRSRRTFFPPSVLSTCHPEVTVNGLARASNLTAKQKEVLGLLRQGCSNKAIARQRGMSEATVKVHVRRIMHKFGVANRTQIAVAAMNQSSLRVVENGKERGTFSFEPITQRSRS